ncbi:MAG: hypothetical protein ACE15C_12025 [Phycisphaerae bacterium]
MGYMDCPNCARRLHVPDEYTPKPLRCPACGRTFRMAPPADEGQALQKVEEPAMATQAARAAGDPMSETHFDFGIMDPQNRILLPEDESMLRDFGSGSGLLELTRDALETHVPSAAGGAQPSDAQMSDRQFQIVGTALTMANKLVQVYKGELARARRLSLVSWGTVGLIAAVAVVAFWWGMTSSSSADVERSRAAGLADKLAVVEKSLSEEKARTPELSRELALARGDGRKAQDELAQAREAVTQGKAAAGVLTANLDAANAKVSYLEAQVAWLKGATTAPATRPAGPIPATNPAGK